MKTLIYTSIYNGLFGTELGGRPSRNHHYKISLNNILNLNADKFICFTSEKEVDELRNYFYNIKLVSKDKLEFIVFELKNTRYFEKIRKIKNIEEIKKFDRCYEIQYNKFFWLDILPDKQLYDRIYWFDAGLSHNGLFPNEYSFGEGYEKNYQFTTFNEEYLNKLNHLTEDKIIIIAKNNTGQFYWSQTIPNSYYNEYNNNKHIIGGFFGGKLDDIMSFKDKFESLLIKLLDNEKILFMEEQLMSYLYATETDKYNILEFDDWYMREGHVKGKIKYFYHIFID